jgi:hypothetical protein
MAGFSKKGEARETGTRLEASFGGTTAPIQRQTLRRQGGFCFDECDTC